MLTRVRPPFLASVAALLLSSCGPAGPSEQARTTGTIDTGVPTQPPPSEPPSPPLEEGDEPVLGPYDYHFIEKSCDTGIKRFDTLARMCTAIQDDRRNSFCGGHARFERFKAACESHGFALLESIGCRITVLSPGGESPNDLDVEHVLTYENFCVGRFGDGTITPPVHITKSFYADLAISVDSAFVPADASTDDNYSFLHIKVTRPHEVLGTDVTVYEANRKRRGRSHYALGNADGISVTGFCSEAPSCDDVQEDWWPPAAGRGPYPVL